MRLPSIVPSAEVLAGRNILSWTSLAFAAGMVNAIAFIGCRRFVTHITGILTYAGMDAGTWVLATEYTLVLLCFIVGAMGAVLLLDGRRVRGLAVIPWLPLAVVATLLSGVALAGHIGWFGTFASEVESTNDFVLLSILALAMGVQNASIANATGSLVRTTHMTGPATDLGVALAFLMIRGTPAETRAIARRTAILRSSKIAAFAFGGVAAVLVVPHFEFLSFLVPAAICVVVAIIVFSGKDVQARMRAHTSFVSE